MEHLEWNEFLDHYLITGENDPNKWEQLNEFQKAMINELKKAFKRINKQNND